MSDLQLEESELSLRTAEIRRYQNATDLLSAYGDYLEYLDLAAAAKGLY